MVPSQVVKRRGRPPHVAALPELADLLPESKEGRAVQLVSGGDRRDRLAHALVNRYDERPLFAFMNADHVCRGRERDHLADVLFGDLDPKAWWVLRFGVVLLGSPHLHEEEWRGRPGVNQLDQEVERL